MLASKPERSVLSGYCAAALSAGREIVGIAAQLPDDQIDASRREVRRRVRALIDREAGIAAGARRVSELVGELVESFHWRRAIPAHAERSAASGA